MAFKEYIKTWLLGGVLNAILLIIICIALSFNYKSAMCVYLVGIPGFFIKSMLFFTPYIILYSTFTKNSVWVNAILLWIPLVFFVGWYFIIIQFQIETLYTDVEFGYTSRLPHFIVQIFSALIVCVVTTIRVVRQRQLV